MEARPRPNTSLSALRSLGLHRAVRRADLTAASSPVPGTYSRCVVSSSLPVDFNTTGDSVFSISEAVGTVFGSTGAPSLGEALTCQLGAAPGQALPPGRVGQL